ncbi:hypothetical protein KC19_10G128500 [Ceratodon purpureus]|uniref:Uncharacterized protein n=2 Tax=Ceratodon purpureus TaxID=3225 RepID=A0A8T0GLC5_CERPU|nr:hypothetical protein KC19_10G128500 [Ceratodon purpureus]KAG0559780.1 hypothetical protein KC19_10G128500 [Ceratodon purpureus]
MDGESSTRLSPTPEKQKRLRDLSNDGESTFVNRGKPVSEKWKPVWMWLQSLGRTKIVDSTEVAAWLECNAAYATEMKQYHSHGVLVHYVQKCHQRLIHGRNYRGEGKKSLSFKKPPDRRTTNDLRLPNGRFGSRARRASPEEKREDAYQLHWSEQLVKNLLPPEKAAKYDSDKAADEASNLDAETWRDQWRMLLDNEKSTAEAASQVDPNAELKVEKPIGTSPYPKRIKRPRSFYSPERFDYRPMHISKEKVTNQVMLEKVDALTKFELILQLEMRLKETLSRCKGQTHDAHETSTGEKLKQGGGRKSRGGSDTHTHAWAFSEASLDFTGGTKNGAPSIHESLRDREQGAHSGSAAYRPKEVGMRGKRWTSVLNGWDSLGKQRLGPSNWLQKRAYSSWMSTWCAYTSSSAIAQPLGSTQMDQGIQKVLDVRFHPGGEPMLAVSCNEPPHELLLYNLETGRGRELVGHDAQIQAVEFALGGERLVSCASNVVKVWESRSGICLHTLGPGSDDNTQGHTKKISAIAVNELQPCLAATSGGDGDNRLLLWNVSTGKLASDLNAAYRQEQADPLSMDALKFCNEKYLVCGSDSRGGKPAIMQIWDIDALANLATFPAHDSFITCLDTNASGSSVITGSGDGSVNLFDVRTGGNIVRLPLSSTWEITSVSFSSCETFFQASCTGNCTFIWDTRMMPLKIGPRCVTQPAPLAQDMSFRALHQLSHGDPMPTAENAFQVPGFVDIGDQGVNDARWFQNEAVLVTASGNGSVAIWDPSLGQPCVQHISSHSRCINTVAVSPKDQFICTGGDDQKVVLYQNVRQQSCPRWRLTHPLCDDTRIASTQEI